MKPSIPIRTSVPSVDRRQTIDQLKKNLRNLIDTGKIISDEIKRLEYINESSLLKE
jgi:hypothetical protein